MQDGKVERENGMKEGPMSPLSIGETEEVVPGTLGHLCDYRRFGAVELLGADVGNEFVSLGRRLQACRLQFRT